MVSFQNQVTDFDNNTLNNNAFKSLRYKDKLLGKTEANATN